MKKHFLFTIIFILLTAILAFIEYQNHSLILQTLSVLSFLAALFDGVLMIIYMDELKK